MIEGLTLPLVTEPDPEVAGEGSLDPLGLEPLADRLANQIAPGITARMSRIRFLTAIAVASVVCDPLEDVSPGDGTSTPQLAFEWLLCEALARNKDLPPEATMRVPGIDKARAAVGRGGHLDSRAYLKTPRVFGFHGVYKRLALSLGLTDDNFTLTELGDQLVGVWEREQGFPGYRHSVTGSDGESYRQRLSSAVSDALRTGSVQESPKVALWRQLSTSLRPDDAGREERRTIKSWLLDTGSPIRRELVLATGKVKFTDDEAASLRRIREDASAELGARLDAIDSYETFSELVQRAFDVLLYLSTTRGLKPLMLNEVEGNKVIRTVVSKLPGRCEKTSKLLEPLELAADFERHLGAFGEIRKTGELFDLLLKHHADIQAAKPPAGKRPWFDDASGGVVVRYPYRLEDPPEVSNIYIHPFRVYAIQSFLGDLR